MLAKTVTPLDDVSVFEGLQEELLFGGSDIIEHVAGDLLDLLVCQIVVIEFVGHGSQLTLVLFFLTDIWNNFGPSDNVLYSISSRVVLPSVRL